MKYEIPPLPLKDFVETPAILKQAIVANKAIAELKGMAESIPNQAILLNTLVLQESKDSTEIENIVTTHDELFKSDERQQFSVTSKEVYRYNAALFYGFKALERRPISSNLLVEIAQILTGRDSRFRTVPGTDLKDSFGRVVYTPPQSEAEILKCMQNLEHFINEPELSDLDTLVKMAIVHHQFESIHPFFDGNGRAGRILNVLYLVAEGILDTPILYVSRYIVRHKQEYYDLLQAVRDTGEWEAWILFMLKGLEVTAKQSIQSIRDINALMDEYAEFLKTSAPKLYSPALLNTVFLYPYTKTEHVVNHLGVSRLTAAKYLKQLAGLGLMELHKHKNTNYYINTKLVNLFESF